MHRVMESSSGSPSGAVSVSSPPRSCSSVLLLDKWLKYFKKTREITAIHFKTITGRASHFRKELEAKIYCISIKLNGLISCLSVLLSNKWLKIFFLNREIPAS